MDDPALEQHIVKRLANTASLNDIILELCEKHGMTWTDAETLVDRIQAEHAHIIAGKRFPLLFVLALGIFLGGLALVIYNAYAITSLVGLDPRDTFASMDMMTHLGLVFEIAAGPIMGIITGAAMMLGSMVGMRSAWTPLLDRLLAKKGSGM
jgi:hypothetical protein